MMEEYKDSFTLGTAATGGCIKIYGDINDSIKFKEKIEEAIALFKELRLGKDVMSNK